MCCDVYRRLVFPSSVAPTIPRPRVARRRPRFPRSSGDGQIDFEEFLQMMKKHEVKEADELKQAFDVFDKDGTSNRQQLSEMCVHRESRHHA
jgi:Ca2+-binding EF-hand superfamily protein